MFSTSTEPTQTHQLPTLNTLQGHVDSVLFNGANSRLLVRTAEQALVEADVTLTGGRDDIKPGADIMLQWSMQQTLCFPASAASVD